MVHVQIDIHTVVIEMFDFTMQKSTIVLIWYKLIHVLKYSKNGSVQLYNSCTARF